MITCQCGSKLIFEVKDENGVKHQAFGDDFVSLAISDILARLNELEAKQANKDNEVH